MIWDKNFLVEQAQKQQELISLALTTAKRLGSTGAAADIHFSDGFDVDVRLGAVDKLSFHRDQGFSVSVLQDKQKGSATSTDLAPEAIIATVEKAFSMAGFCQPDAANGLPDLALQAKTYPDLDLYHPWQLTPDAAIQSAITAEAAGLAVDPRIVNSEGANVSTSQSLFTYGDSQGFVGSYPSSSHSLSVCLLAGMDGDLERDYDFSVARNPKELHAFNAIAIKAAEKALKRLQPQKIKTGTYPVLLSPDVARSFWGHLIGALSGGMLYRKTSFLVDSLGKTILPKHISLVEQPRLMGALGSAPFDAEGVATQEQMLIFNGRVERYILGSYSARKLGLVTTGNAGGIHNMSILTEEPMPEVADLIAHMDRGLLITEVMGQGVNLLTGDYSRGASGFWIEKGKIIHPISEITIAGHLGDMYQQIQAVANDTDYRGNIRTGSVLLQQMMVASAH